MLLSLDDPGDTLDVFIHLFLLSLSVRRSLMPTWIYLYFAPMKAKVWQVCVDVLISSTIVYVLVVGEADRTVHWDIVDDGSA